MCRGTREGRIDFRGQPFQGGEHALQRRAHLASLVIGAALRGIGQGEFITGLDGFEALGERHLSFSLGSSLRWPDQRAGSWYSAASSRVIWPPIMARR